jgi:acetoin utilization transport system ATP-binding protein
VVEALVTEALHYVFGDNYSFEIESTVSRSQAEAQMWVVIDDYQHSLKDELGGGVVDVCSFVLRVTFWALQVNRTEPVLIFDEPLKNVDSGRLEAIGVMIKSLSERLGVQFILVTHEQELASIADVSYRVIITNGTSTVEKIR